MNEIGNTYDTLTLKEIFVRLSATNDRPLYNYFFKKYYPKLIWFTLLYVKQHNAAEEIVSDVLLTLFKNRQKIAQMDGIEGYLFIVTKNQALKYLRKNARMVYMDKMESEADLFYSDSASPEYEYIGNEFHQVIKDTIDTLPTKRKMVFKLVKEDHLRYKDVAELLDLSLKTVEAHMGLALKTISKTIQDYKAGKHQPTPVIDIKKKWKND